MSRNCLSVRLNQWTVACCISGRTAVPPPTARIDSIAKTNPSLTSCQFIQSSAAKMPMPRSPLERGVLRGIRGRGGMRPIEKNRHCPDYDQHPGESDLENADRDKCDEHDKRIGEFAELFLPELNR